MSASSQAKAAKKAGQQVADSADAATALQRDIYNDQRGLLAPSITAGASATARRMLMQGLSKEEVKAYLRSTSAAVNAPAPGTSSPNPSGPFSGGRLNAEGVWENGAGGAMPTTGATGGEDFSWVDDYEWQSSSPSYDFRLKEGQKALERSKAAGGDFYSGDTAKALVKYGQDYGSNEFEKDWARFGELSGDGTQATGTTVNVAGQYGDSAAANTLAAGQAKSRATTYAGEQWGNFWQGASGIPMYAYGQGWGKG